MLDPKLLRTDLDKVAKALKRRGFELDTKTIQELEDKRKTLQSDAQQLQSERNIKSKAIGMAKSKGDDVVSIMAEVEAVKVALAKKELELNVVQDELQQILSCVPNIPQDSVPDGLTEDDNVEIRRWGDPKKFDFEVGDHVALGEKLGMMDFAVAAKITGSRFVVLKGQLAKLQRALTQFMLEKL